MRTLILAASVFGAGALPGGCGTQVLSARTAGTGAQSCADLIRYEAAVYAGTAVNRPAALPARTGPHRVESYGCGDDRRFRLPGLAGVPPEAALADRQGTTLYLPKGILTLHVTAGHPLHDALWSRPDRFRHRRRGPCRRVSVRGRVSELGPHPRADRFALETGAGTVKIGVDAATEVLRAGASPALVPSERISVLASRCRRSELVIAKRILSEG